jgi:abhydrolase domain-containing protein 6
MDARGRVEMAVGRAAYRAVSQGTKRLLGFTETSAEIAGVRVPFLVHGWGLPVVLVHGFGADKESWLLFARAFRAPGRCVLIPDLPGFGAAGEIPPERASAKHQARALAGLLDHLGYARAHLVGNSMGGGIVLRFAHDYPARASSLTLIDSVGPLVDKSEMNLAMDRGENPLLLEGPDDFDRFTRFVLEKQPPPLPRPVRRYIAEERFARRDAHALLFRGWIQPSAGEGVPEDLESIATPAFVIHGLKDRVIDVSTAKALAQRLPNAHLELMDGIGHAPQMEAPNRVAAMVDRFVSETESARDRV